MLLTQGFPALAGGIPALGIVRQLLSGGSFPGFRALPRLHVLPGDPLKTGSEQRSAHILSSVWVTVPSSPAVVKETLEVKNSSFQVSKIAIPTKPWEYLNMF